MPVSLVYVTAADRDEAQRIGRALVSERLAACVNIFAGMQSLYWWNDQIESSREAVLLVKTQPELVEAATQRIRSLHSYECPCVMAWRVEAGHPDYLAWIERETTPPDETV